MKPFLDAFKQNKKAHRLNVMFSQSTANFDLPQLWKISWDSSSSALLTL